jgi:SAM-dependent MidA family methyltransferase
MVLYEPHYGYYSSQTHILGKDGDFVTAPELCSLFGYTLAKQAMEIMPHTAAKILELGAGTGRLCVDILSYLKSQQQLPDVYYILEVSEHLQSVQRQTIACELPELLERVIWLKQWPTQFSGLVIANEVLDAMPVHRFLWKQGQVFESMILYDAVRDEFEERFVPSENTTLIEAVMALNLGERENYCSEVNLWLPGWVSGLSESLDEAVVLLLDYGFPRPEYYHVDRSQGTLMCHARHRAHPHFLLNPGMQDITAHVDFTAVAEAAMDNHLDVLGFTNQASFLLSNGMLDLLAQESDEVGYQELASRVKILLQSHEMGEIIKVMALGKNYLESLSGFKMFDRRVSLS